MKNVILKLSPEEAIVLLSAIDFQHYTMLEEYNINTVVPDDVPPDVVQHINCLDHIGDVLGQAISIL